MKVRFFTFFLPFLYSIACVGLLNLAILSGGHGHWSDFAGHISMPAAMVVSRSYSWFGVDVAGMWYGIGVMFLLANLQYAVVGFGIDVAATYYLKTHRAKRSG